MPEACVSFGYSGCDKSGHIPGGPIWMLHWLPKGYAPTSEDRLLAVFFDTDGVWDDANYALSDDNGDEEDGPRRMPPLLRVVKAAIEAHLREHPEDAAGHLECKTLAPAALPELANR